MNPACLRVPARHDRISAILSSVSYTAALGAAAGGGGSEHPAQQGALPWAEGPAPAGRLTFLSQEWRPRSTLALPELREFSLFGLLDQSEGHRLPSRACLKPSITVSLVRQFKPNNPCFIYFEFTSPFLWVFLRELTQPPSRRRQRDLMYLFHPALLEGQQFLV